jgi:hypothetical protein
MYLVCMPKVNAIFNAMKRPLIHESQCAAHVGDSSSFDALPIVYNNLVPRQMICLPHLQIVCHKNLAVNG